MSLTTEKKLDAYLAISSLVSKRNPAGQDWNKQLGVDFSYLNAFDDEIISQLNSRAERFNDMSPNRQEVWMVLWHERLRRRGVTKRLDPTVHPEHIAAFLLDEPQSIRLIVENHLPNEIAAKVAVLLNSTSLHSFAKKTKKERDRPLVDDRLLAVVRHKFLRRFVAHEDLFDEVEYDVCTMRELGNLLWNLGLREIAIVCRGLRRMENIAAFLKRFEDDTARKIGTFIPVLGEVSAERVNNAEARVELAFENERDSDSRVRHIGMRIFAGTMKNRSDDAIRFNLQKLPVVISERLQNLILECGSDIPADAHMFDEVIEMTRQIIKGGGR